MEKSMDREEEFLRKRILELAEQSYRAGVYTYTNFLTLSEQAVYGQVRKQAPPVAVSFFGGTPGCERQILRFGDMQSLGYDAGFPICCLEIAPVAVRFSEQLTHRDYLGALMHLGIARDTLGDIMLREEMAYLFCMETIAPFLQENLDQIRHTQVSCRLLKDMPEAVRPKLEPLRLNVPGMRLDVIVARLCHLSRSQSQSMFRDRKVFVNGRQIEHATYLLKEKDVLSIRGYGKFVCDGVLGETRKGNLNLQISRYA